MTDNVYCLVKIIEKDEKSLLLYNLKLNCLIFFYQSKQLTYCVYMDIYCKLSKCMGQTLCSYEHHLVKLKICILLHTFAYIICSCHGNHLHFYQFCFIFGIFLF